MSDFESDDLPAKLRAWKVEPRVPSSFQREVWQRISARQTTRDASVWPQVRQWFSTRFVRPQYATALVALSFVGSIGVAHLEAKEANARHWRALESRYATSIDPLSMAR